MSPSRMHLKYSALAAGLVMTAVLSAPALAEQECQITLSETTTDFGRIIPPAANNGRDVRSDTHELGNRVVSMTASCPQPAKLMLRLQGKALGSHFQFAERGQLNVILSNALIDGRSVDLAHVQSKGEVISAYGASIVTVPGDRVIPVSGGLPVHGAVWTMQVELRPQVPVSELRTRDAKNLEAQLSFQISSQL